MKNWEYALARTLERRWALYRKTLKDCQENFSEGSIHVSRIEARRMAAQLELLRVFTQRRALEEAQNAIQRHLDAFDPLRDAQVQLVILEQQSGVIRGAEIIQKLTAKSEQRRRRQAERRIRRVKTRCIRELVDLLIDRLREGGRNPERMRLDRRHIIRSVDTAFARVVDYRRHMDAAHPETVHRMRIAFKKFRYMMESIQTLFPEITSHRLAAMHAFQGLLGNLQDTDVFLARVDKLIRKERVEASEVAPFRRWLVRRHAWQTNHCIQRGDVVFKFWPLKSRPESEATHGNLSSSSWHRGRAGGAQRAGRGARVDR